MGETPTGTNRRRLLMASGVTALAASHVMGVNPTLGVTLLEGNAINDQGQIVASGFKVEGRGRAYLLTPIPEPSTLALFGMAVGHQN